MIITYSKPSTFQPRNLRGIKYRSLQIIPMTPPPGGAVKNQETHELMVSVVIQKINVT